MYKLFLAILLWTIAISAFSQSIKGYVFLKNGTILKGKYQYFDDLKKYRIESAGNVWIFNASEVDSVSSFRTKSSHELLGMKNDPRIFNRSELGLLIGNSNNSQSAPMVFNSQLNYQFKPRVAAGIGAGIEFLKETYLPVFLNTEYKLRISNSTPYFFIQCGYLLSIEDSRTLYYDYSIHNSFRIWPGYDMNKKLDPLGGLLVNPGLGYLHYFNPRLGVSFSFGYRYNWLHYKGDKDYGLNIEYHRLSLKFGILFK